MGLRELAAISRRDTVRILVSGAVSLALPGAVARAQGRPSDAAHRVHVDAPILADDPVAIPLTVSVDHPMDPDHYIRTLEMSLPTDPVPMKGVFRFTPASGRASVAYQIRSGQGGELIVVAECSRHGRVETRQAVRVAPGGCAVPAGGATREKGGSPSLRADTRARAGTAVAVWAGIKHSSHTGLAERSGRFVQDRPPFFLERMTVYVGDQQVSEFLMTPAVSPDPKFRFFVRAEPGKPVRVVFANNRGERWEATQQLG